MIHVAIVEDDDDLRDEIAFNLRAEGFMVLQMQREEWSRKPHAHVWLMWFKPQEAKALQGELLA